MIMKQSELIARVETALPSCVDNPRELAKVLVKQHFCACDCERCQKTQQAYDARAELRELTKGWKGNVIGGSGKRWVWCEKVSLQAHVSSGDAVATLQARAIVRDDGSMWYVELTPVEILHEPGQQHDIGIVGADDTMELTGNLKIPVCPRCGVPGRITWVDDHPSVRLVSDGVDVAICSACGEWVPVDEWEIREGPKIAYPTFEWLDEMAKNVGWELSTEAV